MKRFAGVAALLMAGACEQQPASESEGAPAVTATATPTPAPTPSPAPTPPIDTSIEAARALIERYHALIADKDYAAAYRLWKRRGGASGMSEEAFAESFARYASYRAEVGPPGEPEGACGSVFVTVPVTVTGTLTDGGPFRLEGLMTVRRVNDVPGSSPEQRQWHIEASDLKPVS